MAQDVSTAPATSIGDCTLDEMENLHIYTTSKSLSLDTELNSTIAKHQQQWLACQKERGDSTRFTFDNYALDGALASHPYGICRIMLPTKTFWKRQELLACLGSGRCFAREYDSSYSQLQLVTVS